MKKSLVALAVLAAAGAASAQSSVTLFGVVDATIAYGKGSNGGNHVWRLTNSGYNSSRLGFRGTEDLGGGNAASFWLEAGVNNDDGTGAASNINNQAIGAFVPATGANAPVRAGTQGLTFNRRSTVSLSGRWGEIRLGRDYSPQFWNLTIFDPYGTNGVGTTQTLNGVGNVTFNGSASPGGQAAIRVSNSVAYFLPGNLGGFYGQITHYRGENNQTGAVTEDDGTGTGLRFGFANGPINVAVAAARTKYDDAGAVAGGSPPNITAALAGTQRQWNIGAQWDFGVAKLMGHYDIQRINAVSDNVRTNGWLIGSLIPVGAGEIRLAYSQLRANYSNAANTIDDPKSRKFAVGYVHNLSRRTALYTTAAYVKNTGGANSALNAASPVQNNNAKGFDLGIRHSF